MGVSKISTRVTRELTVMLHTRPCVTSYRYQHDNTPYATSVFWVPHRYQFVLSASPVVPVQGIYWPRRTEFEAETVQLYGQILYFTRSADNLLQITTSNTRGKKKIRHFRVLATCRPHTFTILHSHPFFNTYIVWLNCISDQLDVPSPFLLTCLVVERHVYRPMRPKTFPSFFSFNVSLLESGRNLSTLFARLVLA